MKTVIFLTIFMVTIMPNIFMADAKVAKQCWTEDENVAHERKCNLYYRCIYGVKVLKLCPEGKLFNSELGNCDDSYNVACGFLETIKNEEFRSFYAFEESTNLEGPKWNEKIFDASVENNSEVIATYVDLDVTTFPSKCPYNSDPYEEATLLPHEKWCNAFYKCSNGNKYLMSCPGMLQFNPKVLSCDWPEHVRCTEQVPSTSTTEATLIKKPPRISL